MFSAIISTWKKSQAAVIVQNLLEQHHSNGMFVGEPARMANTLVSFVWDAKPDLFGGKFGQRPHKLSVAAISLAQGIPLFAYDKGMQKACLLSLGTVISQLDLNAQFYPLNGIDHTLIQEAAGDYVARQEKILEPFHID